MATLKRHVIRPLDPAVVGLIAAGEVVERPAFAVKELVENSIDAGATSITVEIRDGGLTYFRVTDNGCGIMPDDVRMAFVRHATSKLRTAEELSAIHTLGFRGEALASIAAVARVEMRTRASGEKHGVKAVVAGGVIEKIEDAASAEGTTIIVRDLFFNTPARRKFLKKPITEGGLVSDLVLRLILARPDISFRLMNAEKQVYHSSGNGSLKDALFAVLGKDVLGALVPVKGSAAGCSVTGYVGVGEAARGTRQMQTFILNGRYVRSGLLSQAVEEGCRERVMTGKYPVCALHLTMPFESVDVNVHPNKLEVRFQDERALLEGIAAVTRESFIVEPLAAAQKLLPEVPEKPAPENRAGGTGMMPVAEGSASIPSTNRPAVFLRDSATMPPLMPNRPAVLSPVSQPAQLVQEQMDMPQAQPRTAPIIIVGVAWLEYVFVLQEDILYIIDQHAAHERILYERYRKAMDRQSVSQQLLVPQVIELTHREHAALRQSMSDLAAAGFELEDFGDRAVQVRAVPMILGAPEIKLFFGELADCISDYRQLPTETKRRDMLVKLACRKAVKAGDPLSMESIEALINEMRETGAPPTCPHGRPLVVRIDKTDLDKRFRRIV